MTIRWGFLGASWVGTTALAPAVHNSTNGLLQAVASRDSVRSQALQPLVVHESYDHLLADPNIDAVYISLANHQHLEWVIAALNAGKHVLCEKPLALNSQEALTMFEAATKNDRLLVEGIWTRWHPRFVRMVQLARDGLLGDLRAINSAFTFTGALEGNYRLSPQMGGGSVLDVGPYQAHTWVALLGTELHLHISQLDRHVGPTGIDLTTEFTAQLNANIDIQMTASFEREEKQNLSVIGSLATAELIGNESFTSWKTASELRVNDTIETFAPVDAFQLMIEAFGARLLGETSWLPTPAESVRVMKILDQIAATPTS